MSRNARNAKLFDRFGIEMPDIQKDPERKPFETLQDIIEGYPASADPLGNPARQVECFGRYYVTGVIERCHPLGMTDCSVKRGVTLEFKTGHGWIVEPCFESLEKLQEYVEERVNPMFAASHIAYLPARAENGEDAEDCLVMTAKQFIGLMGGKYGHLQYKENRGSWGIAIKPWIREGYVQKPSAKAEQAIMNDLLAISETLREFTERMGLEYHG